MQRCSFCHFLSQVFSSALDGTHNAAPPRVVRAKPTSETRTTGEVPSRTPPQVKDAVVVGHHSTPGCTAPAHAEHPLVPPASSSTSNPSLSRHHPVPRVSTCPTAPAMLTQPAGDGPFSAMCFGSFDPCMMLAQQPTAVPAAVLAPVQDGPPTHSQAPTHVPNPRATPASALNREAPARVSLSHPSAAAAQHHTEAVSGSSGSSTSKAAAEVAAVDAQVAQGADDYYDVAPKSPSQVRKVVVAGARDDDKDIPTAISSPTALARISITTKEVAGPSSASMPRATSSRPQPTPLSTPPHAPPAATTHATVTPRANITQPSHQAPASSTALPARPALLQVQAVAASAVRSDGSGSGSAVHTPAPSFPPVQTSTVAVRAALPPAVVSNQHAPFGYLFPARPAQFVSALTCMGIVRGF